MASLSSVNNISSVFQKRIFFIARITCTFIRIQEWENEGPEVTHSQSGHLTHKSQKLLSLILHACGSSSSFSPWNPALALALSHSQWPFCPLSIPSSLTLTPDSLVSINLFLLFHFHFQFQILYYTSCLLNMSWNSWFSKSLNILQISTCRWLWKYLAFLKTWNPEQALTWREHGHP